MNTSANSGFNSMLKSATLVDNDGKEKMIHLLDTFLNKYDKESVSFNPELVTIVKQIQRKRKEFNATRFFVLVVGPVKSGKSTLVNIFARKYVSPTAYRECTALPTIIGKSSGEHLGKIVQYFPSDAYKTNEDKIETFDYIVDVIREVENQDVLNDRIKKIASELTPEKIKETITLYHDSENNNEQLVATIGIKGGGFIDDEIMLIDMPGLDGSKKHVENTLVYKNMAQRADVVFFVQSSTSAINKSSLDFLNELFADKKGQVPVWLVHNIHDSQYFINDDEKKKVELKEQIELGSKRVKESFGITRFEHLALNLGKIYSALNEPERIKPENKEEIDQILKEYIEQESKLIRILKEERQVIKDEINIGKAQDTIKDSVKTINRLIELAEEKKKNFKNEKKIAEELDSLLNGAKISSSTFLSEYDALLAKEYVVNSWECAIQDIIQQVYPIDGNKIKGKDLMVKIDSIRQKAWEKIPIGIGTNFRIKLCESLFNEIQSGLSNTILQIESTINALLRREDTQLTNKLKDIIAATLSDRAPYFNPFYSDIRIRCRFKRYTNSEQIEYLNLIKNILIENIPGKLTEYRDIIKAEFINIRDEYIEQLKTEIKGIVKTYTAVVDEVVRSIENEIAIMQNMINDLEY